MYKLRHKTDSFLKVLHLDLLRYGVESSNNMLQGMLQSVLNAAASRVSQRGIHAASQRSSLFAGIGAHQIPSVRLGVPLSQRYTAP